MQPLSLWVYSHYFIECLQFSKYPQIFTDVQDFKDVNPYLIEWTDIDFRDTYRRRALFVLCVLQTLQDPATCNII
jgi:hypothetical protein